MKPGWYKRNRYQGVPHWFDRAGPSFCGRVDSLNVWPSDSENFLPVPLRVAEDTGCLFCLKEIRIREQWRKGK